MKKTAEEIIEQLIDEIYEIFPNDSYSDWDIAQHVYDSVHPQWIKIESEEDLPKDSSNYWIFRSDGRVSSIDHYKADKKFFYPDLTATYYMPLIKPEPPKED